MYASMLKLYETMLSFQGYDPRESKWYRAASKHRGDKFILSTPYVDAISQKWIVTFARAITFPRDSKKVYAVIGFDIFIWKLEVCSTENS